MKHPFGVHTAFEARSPTWRTVVSYLLMIAAGIGLFLLIRAHGETLHVPPLDAVRDQGIGDDGRQGHILLHVLLALAAVILLGRILAKGFAYLGQPPVIGEVVAGILLGPSFLGKEYSAQLLPPSAAPYLGMIAQLGVILYMFVVGLELNAGRLRARAYATLAIAHASIVVPFVLGAVLALWLYPRYSHDGVSFTKFSLFIGVALSVTAFPVLARILSDRGLSRTELGITALGCAAINDATAWCLLAFVVGVAQTQIEGVLWVIVLAMAFVAFMFFIVGPLAKHFAGRTETVPITAGTFAWLFSAVLLSALATEAIGIHAIFGAFLLGVVIPHDSLLARTVQHKIEDVVTVLLLPAFFAFTGMRVEIGLIAGWENGLACGLIILAATAGKFGGTMIAARWTGLDRRMAVSLGLLMNTRGLMELIVLNIGLDLGIISPTVFAMMVLMALATTLATTPLLLLFQPEERGARILVAAHRN